MKEFLAKVVAGNRLSEGEASEAMSTIVDGAATPAQIGGLLSALALRGETVDELVGFARALRARALPLPSKGALDTCGTGGDGQGTFNISTVVSMVVAACGVKVAKHGNRSASGTCGSADFLEALRVPIDPGPEAVARSLDEVGWAFLFAPTFHKAARHAALPRKELGVRTAFNLLGPLTNPAHPEAQLVGVPRRELTSLIAECLLRLGTKRAWVVSGSGLDEVSTEGPTAVAAIEGSGIRSFTIRPEDAGLSPSPLSALRGGDALRNVEIAEEILRGELGPRSDVVVLNSAAALVIAGSAGHLREGAELARSALADGRAGRILEKVREVCSG